MVEFTLDLLFYNSILCDKDFSQHRSFDLGSSLGKRGFRIPSVTYMTHTHTHILVILSTIFQSR